MLETTAAVSLACRVRKAPTTKSTVSEEKSSRLSSWWATQHRSVFLFVPCAGRLEILDNDHLKILRLELHKKYQAAELDGYCLYL